MANLLAKAPGLLASLAIGFFGIWLTRALAIVAEQYMGLETGPPEMLIVLLLGLGGSFFLTHSSLTAGINFSAKFILRLGVGMLGMSLLVADIAKLGFWAMAALIGFVVLTILFGVVAARVFRVDRAFGVLSGGAVAVCGASAALAFSAVLPKTPELERRTVLVVVSVTILSTIAMILYPAFLVALEWSNVAMAYVLGGSIHDVAQVVGAGAIVNDEVTVLATATKMMRVASLPILVFVAGYIFRQPGHSGLTLPWFLLMFVALAAVRNILPMLDVPLPGMLVDAVSRSAKICLIIAIAAIGLKTNVRALFGSETRLMALIVAQTVFLLLMTLIFAALWF